MVNNWFTRATVSLVLGMGVLLGVGVSAHASQSSSEDFPPLIHPCDVSNDNGVLDTDLERLCMRVWDQRAYTATTEDGDKHRSPEGPVVVDDLVGKWLDEDMGIIWLRESFEEERALYAKRDQ